MTDTFEFTLNNARIVKTGKPMKTNGACSAVKEC